LWPEIRAKDYKKDKGFGTNESSLLESGNLLSVCAQTLAAPLDSAFAAGKSKHRGSAEAIDPLCW